MEVVKDTDKTTLSSFTMSESKNLEMTMLMNALQLSCKLIARACRKAGAASLSGASGGAPEKLDAVANAIVLNALTNSCVCAVLVSEEEEDPILVPAAKRGRYCVAFDPLDGASNIECNVSTGTIFSVYERVGAGEPTVADVLKPGTEMVAAGYCMYGSATDMVVSFGAGAHRFTLDDSVGEFVYFGPVRIPPTPKKIFSCNEGNYAFWDPEIRRATDAFKAPPPGGKPYSARYVGSMVSDVHRTLLYGGVFYYPADSKAPKGKLRVLYEGYPMALLTEQAGGVASTGMFKGKIGRIMEVVPENVHDRCPIIMGCARDVEAILAQYQR
jgi:fructose-1,6-bisphosphatase I